MTKQQVLAVLMSDEPDYAAASVMGEDALPHLDEILSDSSDSLLASKATYLVGMIGGERAAFILRRAAASEDSSVRAAAAGAAAHVAGASVAPVLERLLDDAHADVRRLAAQSLRPDVIPELRYSLEKRMETERDPTIRDVIERALRNERY